VSLITFGLALQPIGMEMRKTLKFCHESSELLRGKQTQLVLPETGEGRRCMFNLNNQWTAATDVDLICQSNHCACLKVSQALVLLRPLRHCTVLVAAILHRVIP
jgi:hypothetical protein